MYQVWDRESSKWALVRGTVLAHSNRTLTVLVDGGRVRVAARLSRRLRNEHRSVPGDACRLGPRLPAYRDLDSERGGQAMSDVVARAKSALEGVTSGPWVWDDTDEELVSQTTQAVLPSGGTYPAVVLAGVWHNDDTAGVWAEDADAAFIAAARHLVPELVAEVKRLREVLDELVDPDPCRFDHDGDCQAHGFFGITADTPCAHEQAKRLLEVNR